MENSNINEPVRTSGGIQFWTGLLILIIGFVIGAVVARYAWRGHPSSFASDPSGAGEATATASQPAVMPGPSTQPGAWNPFEQMSEMQAQIDQLFQRSVLRLRDNPKLNVFQVEPGYSFSMDVRNLKNEYQVRAYLPDTKASDVKVNLVGDQLKVDVANSATQKEMTNNTESTMTEWGHCQEVVRLAGPLRDNQMKIERKAHELVITVPKAEAATASRGS